MELSVIKVQYPASGSGAGERRRRIRHKLHTPVYASFNRPNTGLALELSEVLDLNEEGFAVQTSERLEVNHDVSLSLDLPETKAYIQATGKVVWSDGAGRGGIRFSGLPASSRELLKEWIFVNLMVASTQTETRRTEVDPPQKKPPEPATMPESAASLVSDLGEMLSAVDAVRLEVRAVGDDFDAALHLITERARNLTGASSAALAFLTSEKMICRARSGEPAPALGIPVDVKHGLTGECVRSGRMVACADAETDPRVDREICRALGIGSILASPIVSDFRVVGLLEIFSPHPGAFSKVHETVLDRLVEIVPKAKPERAKPTEPKSAIVALAAAASAESVGAAAHETIWEPAQEPLKGVPVRLASLALLGLTLATIFLVLGYTLAPTIERRWFNKPQPVASKSVVPAATIQTSAGTGTKGKTVEDIRSLAEQGNADAQWDLASLYHSGNGVPQDDVLAVQWFLRAAEQGHVGAQASLGAYYWAGRGAPEDLSKAYFWSLIALAQGDDTMKSRLEGLAARMTKAQVNSARQQADDWLRQHHATKSASK